MVMLKYYCAITLIRRQNKRNAMDGGVANEQDEKADDEMAGGDMFAGAADGERTGEFGGGRGSGGGDIGSG